MRAQIDLEFEYDVAIASVIAPFFLLITYWGSTRNNFWTYLTIVILPDLAVWRWPMPKRR